MNDNDETPDASRPPYEVGYGKPPLSTRFSATNQPKSGGRKKGAKGLRTEMRKILTRKLVVRDKNGRPAGTASPVEALLTALLSKGAAGNVRANEAFLKLMTSVFGFEDDVRRTLSLSEEDEQILAAFAERIVRNHNAQNDDRGGRREQDGDDHGDDDPAGEDPDDGSN